MRTTVIIAIFIGSSSFFAVSTERRGAKHNATLQQEYPRPPSHFRVALAALSVILF